MLRLPGGKLLLGKVGYGLGCIAAAAVLVTSGVSYYATKAIDSIGTSPNLVGGPSTGAMNILIMGLESRTFWDGTSVDHHLATVLHIGTANGGNGGNAANTLILLHIFAGGQKAVGFSIPRDDYVQMVGTLGYGPKMSKIDNAYGYAMYQQMQNDLTAHPSWSYAQRSVDGNYAGQNAEIQTVEALTGVKIDKFAELNLVGFYVMASVFHGAEVCVLPWPGGNSTSGYIPRNGNLRDPVVRDTVNGGWQGSGSIVGQGIQHLTPEQTLAFVRNRHNLPGGDVARTYRQQAILDYVLGNLRSNGALSDVGKLTSLVNSAKNFLAVPQGWNLVQFGGEIDALTGKNLTITTLPETAGPNVPGIGDVDTVNVPAIQAQVQKAFSAPSGGITTPAPAAAGGAAKGRTTKAPVKKAAPALAPSKVTVDVTNSSGVPGHGSTVRSALTARGYLAGSVATGTNTQALTTVSYGAGAQANATAIAKLFGSSVSVAASSSVPARHVLITLGVATQTLPLALGGPTPTASPATSAPSASSSASNGSVNPYALSPQEQQWVREAKAKYGIPCEY